MSNALRLCQNTLTAFGMTPLPSATACFPTTTAAVPAATAASATMSSVWSCLQSAGIFCNMNADCATKTYTVGQVPSPTSTPTIGANLLSDGGFESGNYGNWTLVGFNQHLVPAITTARRHSGSYAVHFHYPNTNGISATLQRDVFNIQPGKPYQFRFWVYHENPAVGG